MDEMQVEARNGPPETAHVYEHHQHEHKHKHHHKSDEEAEPVMAQGLDVQEIGGGGMGMGGIGGGLLGGILGGALLGGGLGNNRRFEGEGCVTPSQLTAALAGVQDTQMNTAVLQQLGAIQASVPLAEAQVQLALAGSTATVTAGQAITNKAVADAIASSLASQNQININVLQTSALLASTIKDDGEKTRALITAQNEANLQRQLSVAESALAEQRAEFRSRANEINITQTVNQNQAQVQAQQQQQQQTILLAQLCAQFNGLQNAVATNSNLIVGNTGAVATGPQTANPVNVHA